MKRKLQKLWEEKFDHIYLQHYPKYKERLNPIISELKRIGIYNASNFSIYYSIPNELEDHIYNYFNDNDKLFSKEFTLNFFRCGYTFYKILCESVELEYKKVLIIHDDIKFLKKLKTIYDILENIPEEYDVCLFDYLNCYNDPNDNISINDIEKINDYYYSYNCLLGNTIGAYSYNYMKVMIDCNNHRFGHTDSYISNIWSTYDAMAECGYYTYNYRYIFCYPRIAIQHEYQESLAKKLFNVEFTNVDQYQCHPIKFLNKDIDYSKYNI